MSFFVYAHRVKGDLEVRYIGHTGASPQARIANERSIARTVVKWGAKHDGYRCWLLNNEIESVVLADVGTREEARIVERAMCVAFARLGHRLFNRSLVPAEYRRAA